MTKSTRISYTLASMICLGLIVGVLFANIYPCGYWDKSQLYEDRGFAGYGYESLATVLGNGFFWEADEVPEPFEQYHGGGPYYVMGLWWISLLYIPIFLGIFYFGWIIAGGTKGFSISLFGRRENAG